MFIVVLEGPGAMVGSALIGGFILAMIEGVGIMINRYSHMLMPQGPVEGRKSSSCIDDKSSLSFAEGPVDLDKGKIDLSVPPSFFSSPPGQSSSTPGHFS